jgi:GGDEF domain-containing protein
MLHASIGFTIIEPDDDGNIDKYIDMADKSMYREKEKYHKLIDSINLKRGS